MGLNKTDAIKIRVTTEQKDLIKRVAKLENSTMSDFVLKHIEHIAENKEVTIKNQKVIEERIQKTEDNIQKIKENLKNRKENNNRSWFKKFFERKT